MADELISKQAFIKSQCNSCDGWCDKVDCDCLNCKSERRCDFIQNLADAPAVDAVEVVRCKDCIFRKEPKLHGRNIIGELECNILGVPMNLDNFCSYGERREENDGE